MKTMNLKTQIIAVGLVVLGFASILTGVKNITDTLLMLDSPLDRAVGTDDGFQKPSSVPFSGGVSSESDFLPVYARGDLDDVSGAPAITGRRPDQFRPARPEIEQVAVLPVVPERMVIEAIGLDSTVVPVSEREIEYQGEIFRQWDAPKSSALGWHSTSAKIGSIGNTVINGHSSGFGESFRYLADLQNGDMIEVFGGGYRYTYVVANTFILKERWESIETRMENASWINRSDDERLTLISCWPYNSNTHRMIVVAVPLDVDVAAPEFAVDP